VDRYVHPPVVSPVLASTASEEIMEQFHQVRRYLRLQKASYEVGLWVETTMPAVGAQLNNWRAKIPLVELGSRGF